jgi:hypothetical protein
MKLRHLPFGVTLLAFSLAFSQETNAPSFGKGLFNLSGKDSTWNMKIGLRFQTLGLVEWTRSPDGGLVNPESNMLIRRSRLKFDGFAFSPDLEYKFELGLANRDISGVSEFTSNTSRYILDAVVKWRFYKNFVVWFGQTKLPGNVERIISSGDLQLVDRSLLNSRFNIDRDMGIQLHHHFYLTDKFLIREAFSLAQGEGRNVTTGNEGGHQYTARLELFPMGEFTKEGEYSGADLVREQHPKLMLAVAYDTNQDAVRTRSNQGSFMFNDTGLYETTINTLFLDASFKYTGFSFMAEYARREANNPIARNSDGSPTGDVVLIGDAVNMQAGYLFQNNWEVSGRYTHIEPEAVITANDPESQYTLGLSKYLAGHKLKIQTDISYLDAESSLDELMYRLQFEIHF